MKTRGGRFIAWASSLVLLVGVALVASAPSADADCGGRFPATGQTTCWDSGGGSISCTGTGQDGDIQAGKTLRYRDLGNGTIKDRVTKLIWEKQSMDGSIHDVGNTYTWANAFAVHVAGLNAALFAGHDDWRLPNVKELQSIVDYAVDGPSIDPVFGDTAERYWSSSTLAGDPTTAWVVGFKIGFVDNDDKSVPHFVRAVRGGCVD